MAMPKAGDDDIAWFDQLLPDAPGVTRRPMFGNLGGFVDGQMFLALLGDRVAVRLDPASRDELLRIDGTALFEPMPGRPMEEYVVLPEAWKDDAAAAGCWIDRSMAYAAGLPPKHAPKRRGRRSRRRASRRRRDTGGELPAETPTTEAAATETPVTETAETPASENPTAETPAAEAPGILAAHIEPRAPARGSNHRPVKAETPSRAHRAARNRAAAQRTTTRSAGRARRSGG